MITMTSTCSVRICHEPAYGRGWCKAHYQRWLTKGDPGDTPVSKKRPGRGCKVEGCALPHAIRGWCKPHYRRWARTGDAGGLYFVSHPVKPGDLTYRAAHLRVRAARGSAAKHRCGCGKPAKQWSYQYNDPDVLVDDRGYLFSADVDRYAPMCTKCHRALDAEQRARSARLIASAPGGLFW